MRLNLALQGGGAHGAFTWGALDRLLEEPGLEMAAISGTSAGAFNGAAVKAGLARGGPEAARENLEWLWTKIAGVSDLRMTSWMNAFLPGAALAAELVEAAFPVVSAMEAISPYAYGAFYRNPLQPIAERFEYEKVRGSAGCGFFVSATNVRTGKIRVFGADEVTPDVLLASACLPTIFQAIEIDGEAYWDGGYTGNPALFPLFDASLPDDILIVNINPLERPGVPRTTRDIQNRINEIGFNTSLLRELRAIAFVKRLIADGTMSEGAMKNVGIHMVSDDDLMGRLSVATKLIPSLPVITELRDAGRAAAQRFLDEDAPKVGKGGSVNLAEMFG